jgi:hypothetical protein
VLPGLRGCSQPLDDRAHGRLVILREIEKDGVERHGVVKAPARGVDGHRPG